MVMPKYKKTAANNHHQLLRFKADVISSLSVVVFSRLRHALVEKWRDLCCSSSSLGGRESSSRTRKNDKTATEFGIQLIRSAVIAKP
jgi:hypothetical protein